MLKHAFGLTATTRGVTRAVTFGSLLSTLTIASMAVGSLAAAQPRAELDDPSRSVVGRVALPVADDPVADDPVTEPPRTDEAAASDWYVRVIDEGGVRVRFESEQRLTLHIRDENGPPQRWCTAPCRLVLAPGRYWLGVSHGDAELKWDEPVSVTGAGTIYGRYVHNGGLRAGGWVVFILSLLSAGGLSLPGFVSLGSSRLSDIALGSFGLAGFHFLLAMLVGLPMITAGDGAVIRF